MKWQKYRIPSANGIKEAAWRGGEDSNSMWRKLMANGSVISGGINWRKQLSGISSSAIGKYG